MKRIAGLDSTPPALAQFHNDAGIETSWPALRNHPAYAETRSALAARQHHLCAYCEIDLVCDDTSIEHIVPRSDPARGVALACDAGNMLAICRGGAHVSVYGPETRSPDPTRALPPVNKNLSCGQAKGNRPAAEFLDPRAVPTEPSIMVVDSEGKLGCERTACAHHRFDPSAVERHIGGLGLNVKRLQVRREAVWQELAESFSVLAELPNGARPRHLSAFAADRLLPKADGRLNPFFTTARSFFGPLAEAILAAPPQSWI